VAPLAVVKMVMVAAKMMVVKAVKMAARAEQ